MYLTDDPSKPLDEWVAQQVSVDPEKEDVSVEFERGQLEPETPYYVRISAENDIGPGVLSEPIHFISASGGW